MKNLFIKLSNFYRQLRYANRHYDVKGQYAAGLLLECSTKTLYTKIQEGTLKKYKHYIYVQSKKGTKRYSFNRASLLKSKGKI